MEIVKIAYEMFIVKSLHPWPSFLSEYEVC